MFHIVTLLLFSSIMFAAVYQFRFNKNDMMMMKVKGFKSRKGNGKTRTNLKQHECKKVRMEVK